MIPRHVSFYTSFAIMLYLFTQNIVNAESASINTNPKIPIINFTENGAYKEKAFYECLETIYFNALGFNHAYERYYSWCCENLDIGPQKVKYTPLGILSVQDTTLTFPKTKIVKKDPGLEHIRVSVETLNNTIQKAIPIINEAENYYRDKSYKLDDFEGGREIHKRLHPVLNEFNAAFSSTAEALVANIEPFKESYLPKVSQKNNESDTAFYTTTLLYFELMFKKRLKYKAEIIEELKNELETNYLQLKRVLNSVTINNAEDKVTNIGIFIMSNEENALGIRINQAHGGLN